jgi:hypothetical protein
MATQTMSSPPTDVAGAAAILARHERAARPILVRLGEIADQLMTAITDDPALVGVPMEDRHRRIDAAASGGTFAERTRLGMDLHALVERDVAQLTRWLQSFEDGLEQARANDPELATPEGQARRFVAAVQAQDLSRLPVDRLVAEARSLLAKGDPRGAEVRLSAARLTGAMNPTRGTLKELADEVDAALDQVVPHRVAATEALTRARVAWTEARLAVGETQRLGRELSRNPDGDYQALAADLAAWIARGGGR